MPIKPEDILPDNQNHAEIDGIIVRKGSIAAAMANVGIIESLHSTEKEKNEALEVLKALIPGLKKLGLTKFLTWKNHEIQKMFDETE